jgi:hypothetical protein
MKIKIVLKILNFPNRQNIMCQAISVLFFLFMQSITTSIQSKKGIIPTTKSQDSIVNDIHQIRERRLSASKFTGAMLARSRGDDTLYSVQYEVIFIH